MNKKQDVKGCPAFSYKNQIVEKRVIFTFFLDDFV